MYKELDKYKTGNIVKVEYEVGNGYVPLIFNEEEYLFKLGDLLIDFNKHLNKYFLAKNLLSHRFDSNLCQNFE